MKILLDVQETLIWHDYPQLFVAKDKIGGLQLCLAVNDEPLYLAVAISTEKLKSLKQQKIDLHSVFAQPELDSWFRVELVDNEQLIAREISASETIPDEWLPTPNEFLPHIAHLQPETFEVVKISAVAKEAGMNPTLLRQYVAGIKKPSPEQSLRVQNALHRVAQRLLEVRLV